jgi:hypothetical protein
MPPTPSVMPCQCAGDGVTETLKQFWRNPATEEGKKA